jgi:hypothetical protein
MRFDSLIKSVILGLSAFALISVTPSFLMARNDEGRKSDTTTAGSSGSPKGMILRREEPGEHWVPGTKWAFVGADEALPSNDLLVGLPGAELDSANRAVRVRLLTDFDSPLPVLEPAVLLHATSKRDLELTLDRGMIELVSMKKGGSADVRVHVQGADFDLTLYTAGTKATLLLASAWPKGVPFKKDPGPKDVPFAELIIVVQKGDVDVRHDGRLSALEAPPGPAVIQWDNVHGLDVTPTRLEKLPDWILPPTDPAEKEKVLRLDACVKAFCKDAADHSLDDVLDHFLNSEDKTQRHFGVILLGATDNLSRLAVVLNSAKHLDMWDATVKALRHWIGRGPGQDQVLYKRLVELRNYKPAEAGTVLHFLHTPDDVEMSRPETYEMLIDHLNSERLAIRGLAFWHLYRLVPEGRKIAYDPLAPREERERARSAWKQLVPEGKLPPKPTVKEQEKKP